MKNLFASKTLWIVAAMVFLGIGGDKKVSKILTTFELSPREALELLAGLGACGGVGYARYLGDNKVFTPKGLSGRDKINIFFDEEDDDDTEVNI